MTPVKPVAAPAPEQLVAADFNGDGIGDVGFRNSATGVFTMRNGPSFANQVTYPWAVGANYQPFAADFNADKVADLGLRDSTQWHLLHQARARLRRPAHLPVDAGANVAGRGG